MVELGCHWNSEEEFLSKFIMFPKTKNIDELRILQDLGYALYFEYNNTLIDLCVCSSYYVSNLPYIARNWIRQQSVKIDYIYTTNVDRVNAFVDTGSIFHVIRYYVIYD